jgi:hypothetical protein
MRVPDKLPIAGVFPVDRRHRVWSEVVAVQPKTVVMECTAGGRLDASATRAVQWRMCASRENFSGSARRGYIIVRDIVSVGVCGGG